MAYKDLNELTQGNMSAPYTSSLIAPIAYQGIGQPGLNIPGDASSLPMRPAPPQRSVYQVSTNPDELTDPPASKLFLAGLLGGPQAVEFQYQKHINAQARPIMGRLQQELTTSLNVGDYDRANEAILGMSQLAGKAPQFGPMVQKGVEEVNRRKVQYDTNTAQITALYEDFKDQPEKLLQLGRLSAQASILSPELFRKNIEDIFPDVTPGKEVTVTKDKRRGTYQRDIHPGIRSFNEQTAETKRSLEILMAQGILNSPQEYFDIENKIASGEKLGNLTGKDIQRYQIARDFLYKGQSGQPGLVGQQINNALMSPAQQIEQNVRPDVLSQITGTAPRGSSVTPPTRPVQPQGVPQSSTEQPQGYSSPYSVGTVKGKTSVPDYIRKELGEPPEIPTAPKPGQSPTEFQNDVLLKTKAKQTYLQQVSELIARRDAEGTGEQIDYFKLDSNTGLPQQYQGPTLSRSEMSKQGWYKSAAPSETKQLRDFSAAYGQVKGAFETLKSLYNSPVLNEMDNDTRSKLNRILATGVEVPIRLGPLGGVSLTSPRIGTVALTKEQAQLYAELAGAGQAVEQILNIIGKDNKAIGTVKDGITGAFTDSDTALAMLATTMKSGRQWVVGRMASQPGAVPPGYKIQDEVLPPRKSSGGAAQFIEKKAGEPGSSPMAAGAKSYDYIAGALSAIQRWFQSDITSAEKAQAQRELGQIKTQNDIREFLQKHKIEYSLPTGTTEPYIKRTPTTRRRAPVDDKAYEKLLESVK